MSSMDGNIAQRWRELQGKDNWKDLLEPKPDLDLRRSIIIYGNLTSAVGDAYEDNPSAKYPRDCRYNKDDFFKMVGLEKGNSYKYRVTKYIYTTSVSPLTKKMTSHYGAYVAVATDEGKAALGRRDVVVAWTGSITWEDQGEDFTFPLVDAAPLLGKADVGKVHEGFLGVYTTANKNSPFEYKNSARDQVLEEVRNLVDLYKDEELSITVTGTSLGAALATLNSIDIVANGYNRPLSGNPAGKPCPVTGVLFGSPRVGDPDFCNNYNTTDNLKLLKVKNAPDPVPKLPPPQFGYSDCGVELAIDTDQSPYLKTDGLHRIMEVHYVEVYLHGVAGTQGSKGGFHLEVDRQLALVNKGTDVLKDNYNVPAKWWKETKGMVQAEDGTWKRK